MSLGPIVDERRGKRPALCYVIQKHRATQLHAEVARDEGGDIKRAATGDPKPRRSRAEKGARC